MVKKIPFRAPGALGAQLQRPLHPDPKADLGRRIKELRALHALTQEELADRSGLFRTYMSRVESGKANPTLTMLYQISSAFAIDVRELFVSAREPVARRVRSSVPTSRGRVRR